MATKVEEQGLFKTQEEVENAWEMFISFKKELAESKYDLETAMPDIEAAFLTVLKKVNETKQLAEVAPIATKKEVSVSQKKKSGYTLFLSHQMGEKKLPMKEAVGAWKLLEETEKTQWNAKAASANAETAQDAPKKTKKKSGYTVFMSHKMGQDKLPMKEAVAAWKALEEAEKAQWNQKAKESQ